MVNNRSSSLFILPIVHLININVADGVTYQMLDEIGLRNRFVATTPAPPSFLRLPSLPSHYINTLTPATSIPNGSTATPVVPTSTPASISSTASVEAAPPAAVGAAAAAATTTAVATERRSVAIVRRWIKPQLMLKLMLMVLIFSHGTTHTTLAEC
jgi:hypothetical protein